MHPSASYKIILVISCLSTMFHIVLLLLTSLFYSKTESSLILCSEKVSRVQVCQNKGTYRPNVTPYPRLCVVKPVVDIKDVLDIDPEKKTITVYLYIILQWVDDGLNYAVPEGEE